MSDVHDFTIHIFRFLLRLYPATFRTEFEEQMLLGFADMAEDVRKKGRFAFFKFLLKELVDFPVNLLRIHIQEGRILKVLRSQPVNAGLSSATGFGVAFALAMPITMFLYEKLGFWLDPIVTNLQVTFYDRFHTEQGFELISRIPSGIGGLLAGIVLGIVLAVLHEDRAKFKRTVLVGMLGWLLYSMVGQVFIHFNWRVFLEETQQPYFNFMILAFSGAVFGLVLVILNTEGRGAVGWLAAAVIAYPSLIYFSVDRLFDFFVFRSPWRFVSLVALMILLYASVIVVAMRFEKKRKLSHVILAGMIGAPAIGLLLLLLFSLIHPLIYPAGTAVSGAITSVDQVSIGVSNTVYGVLLGLVLGLASGWQKQNELRPSTA